MPTTIPVVLCHVVMYVNTGFVDKKWVKMYWWNQQVPGTSSDRVLKHLNKTLKKYCFHHVSGKKNNFLHQTVEKDKEYTVILLMLSHCSNAC